jgi:hypothetical protein
MEPNQNQTQSANAYYSNNRKRSFFYSRVTVVTSMVVLVAALGINVYALYNQQTTTQSRASQPVVQKNLLPPLPTGCEYQQTDNGLAVVCGSPTPAQAAVALNVQLPQLPPQCSVQTSTKGNKIICTTSHAPIPTVPVTLPANCTPSGTTTVSCTQPNNQKATISLPALPEGCSYEASGSGYFVVCK